MKDMTDTKEVILALKQVKEEKKLSLDTIIDMMKEQDYTTAVSKTTLSRVFAKGSEDQLFRYETTLRPIANALLDMETIEEYDDTDTRGYKSILKLKKDLLLELERQNKELKNELKDAKLKYHQKLEAETAKFQRSLDFAKTQIELKDKRIDQLMNANDRLSITNNRMLNQILDCPLKNKGCDNEG